MLSIPIISILMGLSMLDRIAAVDSILRELLINNHCDRPVELHEADGVAIGPGESAKFTEGVDMSGDRISFMYSGGVYINDNISVLELNGMFNGGIGVRGPKRNLNFIAQWGFMDLQLDVALWADSARSRLVCRDGRARCLFSSRECQHIMDGSARYEEHGTSDNKYGFCRSVHGSNISDPRACIAGYALYVNNMCQVFDRATSLWQQQGRSVGYSIYDFKQGKFTDGKILDSTLTGREEDLPAVTFECWESPCIMSSSRAACHEDGHTTVGNSGFAVDCDTVDGLVDVAVLEITTCPTSVTTTAATTASQFLGKRFRDVPPQ